MEEEYAAGEKNAGKFLFLFFFPFRERNPEADCAWKDKKKAIISSAPPLTKKPNAKGYKKMSSKCSTEHCHPGTMKKQGGKALYCDDRISFLSSHNAIPSLRGKYINRKVLGVKKMDEFT